MVPSHNAHPLGIDPILPYHKLIIPLGINEWPFSWTFEIVFILPDTVKFESTVDAPCKVVLPDTLKFESTVDAPCKVVLPDTLKFESTVDAPCKVVLPLTLRLPLIFPPADVKIVASLLVGAFINHSSLEQLILI